MTVREAETFIRKRGVVLESARGATPSLAEAIAGGPIRGSWWAHPESQRIFDVTREIRRSDDILVCRLGAGKVTFVHRRLWPALVKLASRIPCERLARLREIHTQSGQHRVEQTPFPEWVPNEVVSEATLMSDDVALAQLRHWIP